MIDNKGLPLKSSVNYHITSLEVKKFFNSFEKYEVKFKLLFLIMASTGLRIGEAISIQIPDFVKGSSFTKVLVRLEKKRKFDVIIERVVPDMIAQMIREYLLNYPHILSPDHNPSNFLFPCLSDNGKGKRMSYVNAHIVFSRIRKRAGLDEVVVMKACSNTKRYFAGRVVSVPYFKRYRFNTHSLRRLFITRLNKEYRLQSKEIASLIGHEDSKVTEKYISEKEVFDNARFFANDLYGKEFWTGIDLSVEKSGSKQIVFA